MDLTLDPQQELARDIATRELQHGGQARMAHRLGSEYAGKLLHAHGLGWLHWDGARWRRDEGRVHALQAVLETLRQAFDETLRTAEEHANQLRKDIRKCESASGIAGVLEIASALETLACGVNDLDADPHLLNVANGTVDLRTMELRPHNPADRITKVCNGIYDPDCVGGRWGEFLEQVLPDADVRGYVQRLVGVGLLGEVREHTLPIFTGTGANGKSVCTNAIQHALGDYASSAEPDLFLSRQGAHPTGEMDLLGVRWVTVAESDRDRKLAEATMKRLTGGDMIKARKMRQDFVEFKPSHTAIMVTNHPPTVSGDDPAIWRRLRVVPFDVVVPEKDRDPKLSEHLREEASAVLSWAIAGYQQYAEIGLAEPKSVTVATSKYKQQNDVIGRFIADECVAIPGSTGVKATTAVLFAAFEVWQRSEGVEALTLRAFGQALDRAGYPAVLSHGNRWRYGLARKELGASAD